MVDMPPIIIVLTAEQREKNPLLEPRILEAVGHVLKTQARTGPYPITQAILDAVWLELLK
jgi:hypothetical protein